MLLNVADTESGGARRDFMGYYTLLGLDGDVGSAISQPDIKKAFHEAALRWHPDHLHVSLHISPIHIFARADCFASL